MKIEFTNTKGIKLAGILSVPEIRNKDFVVLMCSGYPSNKDSEKYIILEEKLNAVGISTFRFDYLGMKDSHGDPSDLNLTEGIDDTQNAIKYLNSIGHKKVVLIGGSFGGAVSIEIAKSNKDIIGLVLLSAVIDFYDQKQRTKTPEQLSEWKSKGYIFKTSVCGKKYKIFYDKFYEDIISYKGYESCKDIKVPTLLIHGELDKEVPADLSVKASRLIQNCRLEIVQGADHDFENKIHFDQLISLTVDYISKLN